MKKILTLLCVFSVCAVFGYKVNASEVSEAVPPDAEGQEIASATDVPELPEAHTIEKYDEKKGIASIRLMYVADTGARDIIKSGYAFFIGSEDSIYLISGCDTVILTEEEKNAVAVSHGVTTDRVKTVIELVLKNDVIVELSIVNSSEGMDFAILQPATKLSSCTTIRLCTENNGTKKGDTLRTYDADMQQIDCTIDDWTEINNAHYYAYRTNQDVAKGLPLMNTDGEVVAIASSANKGNPDEKYALQIEEVTEVLDVLGIIYNPEIVVDTTILEEQIMAFEELESKKYTEDSWRECEVSYENAKALLRDIENGDVTSYTQNEIDEAVEELTGKIDNLKKRGISVKTMVIIAIAEGVVLLITIIILVILLIVKTNKYKKLLRDEENHTVKAKEALKLSGRVTPGFIPNNTNMPVNRSLNEVGNANMNEGDETSVLGVETNYNSGYLNKRAPEYPSIMRYKTGETITISQNSFIVGTAAESVDYCVKYNSNISRRHACIVKFEDGYYIQDLQTTNGTYVNGIRVMPGRYMKLGNGNIIKLAEEEFEFKE